METLTVSLLQNLEKGGGMLGLVLVMLVFGVSTEVRARQMQSSASSRVSAPAGTTDSLTVVSVVRHALKTYPSIEASNRDVNAAQARVGQAQSGYWPRVEAVGTYRRQDPVPEITVPGTPSGPGGGGGGRNVGIQPNNLYDGHLQVRQTLYDFGRTRARVDQAKAGRTAAKRQVDTERSDIAFEAVRAFYTTLLADARTDVQQRQIEQLERTLDVVRRRQEAGVATEFEIQSTLARLSEARSQLTRLQSQRRNQEAELRRLLGRTARDSLMLSGALDSLAAALSPVDAIALADSALLGHPSVQVAEARVQAARRQVRVTDKSDAPTLSLTGQGGVKNGYPDDLGEPRLNESVGLSLQVPLFEGFAPERREDEAEAEVQAAEARLTDVRRQVETRVEQAASDLRASQDQLEATKTRLNQARAAARLARTRYEAGTITNLELLEAETELRRARLDQTELQYKVVMGRYALQRAAGTLLPFETPSP